MRKQKGARDDTTPDVLKPSFKLACETLESNYLLLKDGLASNFQWFFNMYTQWYALAYVLRCLCGSTLGFETERAWTLVEELFPRGKRLDGHSAGNRHDHGPASIWTCLNLLRSQALSLRQRAQLSVASQNVEFRSSSTAADGISTLPESGHGFLADSNQSILPSLDLSMSDMPFLPDPDWDAIINGWLVDDGHSSVS